MRKKRDLTGMKIGRLTYVRDVSPNPRKALFVCDCGREHIARVSAVMFRDNPGCGCRLKEYQDAGTVRTHGLVKTPTYRSWTSMRQRCLNPNATGYHRYGGRGIRVCDRWASSFEAFLADMGERPSLAHTLERIDNNAHYEPGNCRWATKTEQQRNRRVARLVTYNGETKTIHEWAKLKGLLWTTINQRLRYGWSVEEALERPPIPTSERGGLRIRSTFLRATSSG